MKKRIRLLLLASVLLMGCGKKTEGPMNGTEESSKEKTEEISLDLPETENGNQKEEKQEETGNDSIDSVEGVNWKDLEIQVDKVLSMQNSNRLNWGYLTADEEGMIYFVDFKEGVVFRSGQTGAGKEVFYEGIGTNLLVSGGYLYFKDEEKKLIRIRLDNREAEYVWNEACGEFLILQDMIYINTSNGLVEANLDGSESKKLREAETGVTAIMGTGDRLLIYNTIKGEDAAYYLEGNLFGFIEGKEYFIDDKVLYPLVAGKWISVYDLRTNTRHVWDAETGADTDLEEFAQQASSDGNQIYFVKDCVEEFQILTWNGTETKELFSIAKEEKELETPTNCYLYLTEEYLYWIKRIGYEQKCSWGYYKLTDGQMGMLQEEN